MAVIQVSYEGDRADVVLSRPDVLNAMDFEVFDALAAAADEVAASEARVAVFSGAGRSFSAGIDVTSLGSVTGEMKDNIARAQAGFRKVAAIPFPTIAKVHGHALGAGLQLALACDLRVMATDAKVGLLEANYGLIPDLGGSTRLPQLVGTGRAKAMIWLAEKISGADAERFGLAEWTVAADDLDRFVDDLAGRLAAAPYTPTRESKKLIEGAPFVGLPDGMDAEAMAQERCMTAPDFSENLMAGISKLGKS
jgi:enoyl-CoA hydratase/carnithine racemase